MAAIFIGNGHFPLCRARICAPPTQKTKKADAFACPMHANAPAQPSARNHETWAPTVCASCGGLVDSPYWPAHTEWHRIHGEVVKAQTTIRLVLPPAGSSADGDAKAESPSA
jgi:hypothetical protein